MENTQRTPEKLPVDDWKTAFQEAIREKDALRMDLDAQIKRGDIWQEEAEKLRGQLIYEKGQLRILLQLNANTLARAIKAEAQRDELLAALKPIELALKVVIARATGEQS